MPCTLRRSTVARAHHDGRLGPGRSAAPGDGRLVLLPSGPDTVRGSPLRGTRSSTSRTPSALESADLGREFSPAGADCRYRAPLVPRLARPAKDTADRTRRRQNPRRPRARALVGQSSGLGALSAHEPGSGWHMRRCRRELPSHLARRAANALSSERRPDWDATAVRGSEPVGAVLPWLCAWIAPEGRQRQRAARVHDRRSCPRKTCSGLSSRSRSSEAS